MAMQVLVWWTYKCKRIRQITVLEQLWTSPLHALPAVGVVQPLLLYLFRKREPLYPSIAQRIAVYSYMLL
jgi:hypothetical protein